MAEQAEQIEVVRLNVHGEYLDISRSFQDKTFIVDERFFRVDLGTHRFCCCKINIRKITPNHNALYCGGCNLRIVLPGNISTFAELTDFLKEHPGGC